MAVTDVAPTTVIGDSPTFTKYNDTMYLGADSAETYTVPVAAYWAIFTNVSTGTVWIRNGGTAVIPTTEVADGTAPMPIPAGGSYQCRVAYGETYSMIRTAGTLAIVGIAVWAGR